MSDAPAVLPTEAEDTRYRLAYDEAMRFLQSQQADLVALQGRALALLSAGTLATAFLGGMRSLGLVRTIVPSSTPGTIATKGLSLPALAALLSLFALLVLCSTIVLWPTGQWVFQLSAKGLVRVFDTDAAKSASTAALYRDFSIRLVRHASENAPRLAFRVQVIRVATLTLAIQVGVLLVLVARR